MRLDQELFARNITRSRASAQDYIKRGLVTVNGILCSKPSYEVVAEDNIALIGGGSFVSRAGEKLDALIRTRWVGEREIRKIFSEKNALDIGASTGGFTECLLRYGVTSVDAVDVGSNQLVAKLRDNPQVRSYENTDIRSFDSGTTYDIIVADLSFISLKVVLPKIYSLSHPGTLFILLIKPQFEVGKTKIKKGIVKNSQDTQGVLVFYQDELQKLGLGKSEVHASYVRGKNGNQEFFIISVRT